MATKTRNEKVSVNDTTDVEGKEICFVIMPFGGWFDKYYADIYYPAIIASGMIPKRADDLYRSSSIVQDVWNYTKKAKIILADLSTKNPNVFYELGLGHALAKPAILIAESIDDIPFDLRGLRIIDYDKNLPKWGEALGDRIIKSIRETLASPNETIPTAFLETTGIKKIQVSTDEKQILDLRQELDSLKKEVRTRVYSSIPSPQNISEQEASDKVRWYLGQHLTTEEITQRMAIKYGYSVKWINGLYFIEPY